MSLWIGSFTACASNESGPGGGGGDAGTRDGAAGDAGGDSGRRDSGTDAGADAGTADAGWDAGTGEGGTCMPCLTRADCMAGFYCAEILVGGRACLPICNPDIPDCPTNFDCVSDLTAEIPEPVCAPVGDRCCVDGDGDLHGQGVGCLGTDCDETNASVHESAAEVCDGFDNDCSGTADDGDPATMCPPGPRAVSTACTDGTCETTACDPAWDDCDGALSNGCETSLRTNADCGACGSVCSPDHGTGDCSTGSCDLATCDSGWGDCDLMSGTGCETSLRTETDCAACGAPCTRPGGMASCTSGTCTLTGCMTGYSNCDGNGTNGCEVNHTAVAGTCGENHVGAYDGDRACGTICGGNTGWDLFSTREGYGSAWFAATVREDSNCPTDIEHRIVLTSPAGTNFDLHVYRSCGAAPDGSSTSTGTTDSYVIREGDSAGSSDTFTYYVEVRRVSGVSCTKWTLQFYGHDC